MIHTIKDLLNFIKTHDIPEDYEIWIEKPDTLAQPEIILTIGDEDSPERKTDFIECMSLGLDRENKIFYIFHHY